MCELPPLTSVPPIWNDTVLRQVLVTTDTWPEDFVLHIYRFHMGDIRSTPRCQRWQKLLLWFRKRTKLLTHPHRSHSSQDYMSWKCSIQSKGGKGVGKGGGKGTAAEQPVEAMQVIDSDVAAVKLFKQRRVKWPQQ